MGRFTVYSKDGQTVRCVLDKLEYTGVFMAERACTSTFISDAKINFDVFDYIDYRGERFELELLPTVKKISKHQYSYDLNFVSLKYELERCMMRNIVPSDNGIVYPTPLVVEFTGTVKYLAERIQACLDAMYGKDIWSITLADGVDSKEKNISMSNQNCWSALSLVNTEYKLNYFVKGRNVTIGGAEPVVNNVFEYGKGKGLYEIERISDADTGIVTKLRAYGGTRNLDYSYPKKPEWTDSVLPANYALSPLRLMLPSFKTDGVTDFVLASNEAIAKYGIREGVITYDDIYPSITGMKNSAGQAIDEIKSVDAITSETQPTFTVQLYDLGFDLNESLTTDEAQLSMKSGALQGYAFAIAKIVKASDGSYTLTLGRNTLEEADTDNFTVPNKDWNMKAGDRFVLLNILMPQEYIRAAENRLLERAKEYIAKYSSTNYSYNIGVDEIFMARNANFYNEIMEGKRLTVNDPEMGIDHENVIIQSLSIKEGEGLIPTFEVTLNNEPSASTLERIQGQISEIETSVNNKFSSQSELSKQYRKKLDKVVWDRNLEERVDDNGKEYLFLTKPLITAYGVTMYAGADVQVPSIYEDLPIDGVTIQWVDGKLVSTGGKGTANGIVVNGNTYTPNEDGIITLPNYPTSLEWDKISGKPSWIGSSKPSYSWDEIGGKPTWIGATKPTYNFSEIQNKPTTLSGYGITDAYTKSDADSRYFRQFGDTYEDGRNTGWIGLGTGTYINAYPDGIAHKIYSYGQVTSFYSSYSRLELYSTHTSSDPNDGNNGIQFRSGWDDDKKSWRMLLDEVNYLHYTDNRYVNKIGDVMTGDLVFAHTSERPSYSGSIGITFREQIANGQGVKLVYNDYDNYRAPAGLILVGEQGGEYFEAPAIYQNGYKVWDAGNKRDMFSSMNEVFTTWGNEQVINVEGDANTYYPVVITISRSKTWNSRIAIHKNLGSRTPSYPGNHDNGTSSMWAMYEGRYHGWDGNSGYIVTKYVRQPYANLISKAEHTGYSVGALVVYLRGGGCEYTVCTDYRGGINVYYERTEISGDSNYPVYVEPTTSVGNQGVLNTTGYDYLVQKAVRLETPRTIFSKPFDGTGNVTGGAKFNSICIETDNNGNDSGRINEINNYNDHLYLQYVSSNNLICCMGGGNVGIGITPEHKLDVNGSFMARGIMKCMQIEVSNYSTQYYAAYRTFNTAISGTDPDYEWCWYHAKGEITRGLSLWSYDANGTVYNEVASFSAYGGNRFYVNGNILTDGGITMYSDLRKKNVLNSIIVPLDVMANADLFDYIFKKDEKGKVRAGTSAQYWNRFLPQVTDTDNEGFFTMSYDVLATTCVLSIAKHFQSFLIEDFNNHETRIEFLERENKELKDSNKEMMNRIIELERRAA